MSNKHRIRPATTQAADTTDRDAQLAMDCDELVILWGRLHQAVPRDSSGLGGEPKRGASDPRAAVINLDVDQAITEIASGAAQIAGEAVRLLNLAPGPRPTYGVLTSLVDWHRSLSAREQPLARHIAADVPRWARQARMALRLESPERELGKLCPFHRDDHPTPLMVESDRARLHTALLRRERPAAGEAALTWQRSDAVTCHHCKRRWSGVHMLRELGPLLADSSRPQEIPGSDH